ncbi:MAG: sterol carrier family protein, partial [Mycobacterium sp.]|nr:sterol carrier family protein [Mycobacterium sp.]
GTPPNVVETDPRTWLLLATGLTTFDDAASDGRLSLSGSRAGAVAPLLPLIGRPEAGHGDASHVNSPSDPLPP